METGAKEGMWKTISITFPKQMAISISCNRSKHLDFFFFFFSAHPCAFVHIDGWTAIGRLPYDLTLTSKKIASKLFNHIDNNKDTSYQAQKGLHTSHRQNAQKKKNQIHEITYELSICVKYFKQMNVLFYNH
jgi:hypothetical protein